MNTTFMQWIDASPFRKNIAILILVFVALILITGTVLTYKKVSNFGVSAQYPQMLNATGRAEEFVKPDTLTFNITVNEEGSNVISATKKVDEKIVKAMAVLKSNGVDEKNIKTISRDVNDTYSSVSERCVTPKMAPGVPMNTGVANPPYTTADCVNTTSKVTGSNVTQTLEVKIPDIDKNDVDGTKQEKLITELGVAGIKTGQVSFTVFNLDEVRSRVREEAIKKAKAEAKVLAKQLGVDLRGLYSFSDNGGGYPMPYMSARAEMAPANMVKDAAQASLPSGEQKINADVSLTYLIK